MDPTRSDDVPAQEIGALKKRLVASERDRKQALAEAAAENRALQLKLQVLPITPWLLLYAVHAVVVCSPHAFLLLFPAPFVLCK